MEISIASMCLATVYNKYKVPEDCYFNSVHIDPSYKYYAVKFIVYKHYSKVNFRKIVLHNLKNRFLNCFASKKKKRKRNNTTIK
jgi:hypothetical protein